MLTAMMICDRLFAAYGQPEWWSDEPYRVMVQAVLVQNTAWTSVLKVTADAGTLFTPERMLAMDTDALEALIRPCGFCKAKAATIRRLTDWYAGYGFDARRVQAVALPQLRKELLSVKGIGAETADVLLVYAFHKPSFVIDAYTRRLLLRLGYSFDDDAAIRAFFEGGLPADEQLYGRVHWLLLTHGIKHCKKTPVCDACPFEDVCGDAKASKGLEEKA